MKSKLILSPDEMDHADLIFLSVKGYHLNRTLDHVKALVEKGAYVLPVLNGIEHIPIVQAAVGKSHVLGGLASNHGYFGQKRPCDAFQPVS
ncbi:ketopantoate reductase family protein [Virgibacillus oceani]